MSKDNKVGGEAKASDEVKDEGGGQWFEEEWFYPPSKRTSSKVWNYIREMTGLHPEATANAEAGKTHQCILCKTKLKASGDLSNATSHLKSMHENCVHRWTNSFVG